MLLIVMQNNWNGDVIPNEVKLHGLKLCPVIQGAGVLNLNQLPELRVDLSFGDLQLVQVLSLYEVHKV